VVRLAQAVLQNDPTYGAELQAWTRRDGQSPDGVPSRAAGAAAQPQDRFPNRPYGDGPWPPAGAAEVDPLVAVLGTTGDLSGDHLRAGFALQRVLLTLTDLGLSCSMYSQPIEVASAREQLRLALGRSGAPQMVLRVGYGVPGPFAGRRPVDDVIDR
jgi:hypothetical protein